MPTKILTALPVYNEVRHVAAALDGALQNCADVLAVDDGSRDGTAELLARRNDIHLVTHPENRGYGAALQSAFDYARVHRFDVLVTIDCDGQHQPAMIPDFVAKLPGYDIVSGSRYLKKFAGDSTPPEERRRINAIITAELNQRLGMKLTDAFCGFKAYRVPILEKFCITETGYAMPLELWVQAVHHKMKIVELAVPLIYLEEKRSFGGSLDHSETRLGVYREVIERAFTVAERGEPCGQRL